MTAVEILERRLERERRAREQAEALLEEKSLELYEAKEAAESSRTQLRHAIDSISQGFLLFDANEKLVLANRRYLEFYPHLRDILKLGCTMAELVLVHAHEEAESEDQAQEIAAERLRKFRGCSGEAWEQPQPDGRTMLVHEERTSAGGIVSVRTDITEFKHTEALLRTRLAAIEAASEGIAITDAQGRFIYMNQEHLRMFGYEKNEQVIGKSWSTLYSPENASRIESEYFPILLRDGSWRGEIDGMKPDGTTVPQEVSLTILEDGGILCATRDITERLEIEKQNELLREQFNQAQRMESIGRLAGGIAHDFNNILAAILGYANFLVEDLDRNSDQHGFATQIVDSGERARNLVQQILAFSRHNDTGFEDIKIAKLTNSVAAMLRPTIPATIELSTENLADEKLIRGNPTQIEQVLVNIIVNARDALESENGSIRISVHDELDQWARDLFNQSGNAISTTLPDKLGFDTGTDGEARAWLGSLDTECDYICIEVSDTGMGIDGSTIRKIFEPFFTTKVQGKGTGLGLSAVLGIVTSHEGALVVESKLGAGTRFLILLPVVEPSGTPDTVPEEEAVASSGQDERILIVDDEEAVRSVISITLKRAGYNPLTVPDGKTALRELMNPNNRIVAVMTDYMMPEMTGLELVREIRASGMSELPVLVCTGYSENVEKSELYEAGASAYLRKPLDTRELLEALRNAIPADKD